MTGTLLALSLYAPAGAAADTETGSPLTPELMTLAEPAVAAESVAAQAEAIGLPVEGPGSLVREGERVVVEAHFEEGALAGVEALEAAGADVLVASGPYQTIALSVEPEDLVALAEVPGLTLVAPSRSPVYYAVGESASTAAVTPANCEGGSVISQGVAQLNVPAARAAFGVHGAGQTVGVISDSFNTATNPSTKAATDEGSNDLPGPSSGCVGEQVPVRVLEDGPSGSTDEGRAMLQVVHDVAPEAQLAFATAEGGELVLAHNIERLAAPVAAGGAGANVIVDDVAYPTEPFFQDGPVAVAIQKVAAAGVAYFTSAGNDNLIDALGRDIGSWEAPKYKPVTCPKELDTTIGEFSIGCMNFSPTGSDSTFEMTVLPRHEVRIDLQWAEPWFGIATDLNAYLFNSSGQLLDKSDLNSIETGIPFEYLQWENENKKSSQAVFLVINRCSGSCNHAAGAGTPRLKFVIADDGEGVSETEYPRSEGGNVVGPTIFGHAGTGAAITLGAVNYAESATAPVEPEEYSSRGPVIHYFGPVTGSIPAAALALPEELSKPNLTASDCAATTFFAELVPPGIYQFCGTSEAAPHAAAVAALMRQMNPVASPGSIVAAMAASATKYPTVNSPEAVGGGLLNAGAAMGVLGPPPAPAPPTPVVTVTKGPKAVSNQKLPSFEFTSSVAATFTCQITGVAPQACTSPFVAPTALGDGAHSFTVTATASGLSGSSAPYAFKIDTKAPKAKIAGHPKKVIKTRKRKVVARFKLKSNEKPVTFYCKVDRKKQRRCAKNFHRKFGRGKHVMKVKAMDAAGNVTAKPAVFSFRVRVLPPKRSRR